MGRVLRVLCWATGHRWGEAVAGFAERMECRRCGERRWNPYVYGKERAAAMDASTAAYRRLMDQSQKRRT